MSSLEFLLFNEVQVHFPVVTSGESHWVSIVIKHSFSLRMDNTIDMFSGLGLDVLGIRDDHIFHNRDLEPLTLFMEDDLSVHNRERTTSISVFFTQYTGLHFRQNQFTHNERVSEHKPLHIFIARGFSVTTHIHEPTVTHTIVFQNGGDVDRSVNTHLSV